MKKSVPQDWNKDAVWANIEAALHRKKRRRFFFWLFFGSATALALAIFLLKEAPATAPLPQPDTLSWLADATAFYEKNVFVVKKEKNQSVVVPPVSFSNDSNSTDFSYEKSVVKRDVHLLRPVGASAAVSDTSVLSGVKKPQAIPFVSPLIESLSPLPLSTAFPALPVFPAITEVAIDTLLSYSRWAFTADAGLLSGSVSYQQTDRSDSESFRYAAQAGIGVEYHWSEHGYVFGGLDYQLLETTYDYTSNTQTSQIIESDSAIVFQLRNQPNLYQSGTITETTTVQRRIVHNNYLHRWMVPVGIGGQIPIGKFEVHARLALRLRLQQQFDGITLDPDSRQHTLNNTLSNQRYFQKATDLGVSTGVQMGYPLTPHTQVYLGVHYQQDAVIPISGDDKAGSYQLWGAQLGCRYQLSGK